MATRYRSTVKIKGARGGARPGAGRPKGSLSSVTNLARRKVRSKHGMLPAELLADWAVLGYMEERDPATGEKKQIKLEPSLRADCAKAAAPYYSQKLKAVELSSPANRPVHLSLSGDDLKGMPLNMLEMLKSVLLLLQEGGALGGVDPKTLLPDNSTDAGRYAKLINGSTG